MMTISMMGMKQEDQSQLGWMDSPQCPEFDAIVGNHLTRTVEGWNMIYKQMRVWQDWLFRPWDDARPRK